MKSSILLPIIACLTLHSNTLQSNIYKEPHHYEWAIVGAGLAGITALAVLLDAGVEPSSVAWIDPEFNVGRVGKYYRNVPGNVQTHRLILYVQTCPFFKNINSVALDKLYTYDMDEYQPLHVIADPLLDFTAHLASKVTAIKDTILSVDRDYEYWALQGTNNILYAQKVILAVGAYPKSLNYDISEIPLDDAIDKERLGKYISEEDSIAVFGGMHSAILILKFLSEYSVKQIMNFYIDPYFYDAPGLEGVAAHWAKTVLEQNPPSNLMRILSTPENRNKFLHLCNKVIYAIGYEQNPILVNGSCKLSFDEHTGIIEPNLYGIGIAFPPTGIFHGQKIFKNGLHTYLNYAKKLIPQWITNDRCLGSQDQELPWI